MLIPRGGGPIRMGPLGPSSARSPTPSRAWRRGLAHKKPLAEDGPGLPGAIALQTGLSAVPPMRLARHAATAEVSAHG